MSLECLESFWGLSCDTRGYLEVQGSFDPSIAGAYKLLLTTSGDPAGLHLGYV